MIPGTHMQLGGFYAPNFSGYAEASEAPSRATWFLLGVAAALLVPSLLDLTRAGSKYAARRLEKKGLNGIDISPSHLREDIREAKRMVRELRSGIKRDERELKKARK